MNEMREVPRLVDGPCLLNIVGRGKTPPIELKTAETMGCKLAILPTLLFAGVLGYGEDLLTELKTGAIPTPPRDVLPLPREAFARFQADEWDSVRSRYRDVSSAAAALKT